jgi:hypothetical protein
MGAAGLLSSLSPANLVFIPGALHGITLTSVICCQNQSDMHSSSPGMKDCEGLNPDTLRRLLTLLHCWTLNFFTLCLANLQYSDFQHYSLVSREDIIAAEMAQTYIVQLATLLLSMKTFCHKLYPLSKGVYCITLTVAL